MQFSVGPRLRARVSPTGHFLELLPPAVPFLPAAEGDAPCPRARVTFGRSPKSDQKVCLKPQVSRLPARLTMSKNMAAYPAKTKIYADRRTTNRLYPHPRCRSRIPRGGALVYRLCGGVLACRFTKCASQQRVFFIFRGPTGRTCTCCQRRQVRDLIIAYIGRPTDFPCPPRQRQRG